MPHPLKPGYHFNFERLVRPAYYEMPTADAYTDFYGISYMVSGERLIYAQDFTTIIQAGEISFIPKNKLHLSPDDLKIENGDILTITTNIKGLDVVHVGFAFWKSGQLYLLHASSVAKKVIEDPLSLYDYSWNKKAHTGVRVIRLVY